MTLHDGFHPGQAEIDAYGNGGFRFAGMSHRGSLLFLPDGIHRWPAETVEGFGEEALSKILDQAELIDTLLIGCGLSIQHPSQALMDRIRSHSIGIDLMATGSAARTYNIMLAENRLVAAALIAVE